MALGGRRPPRQELRQMLAAREIVVKEFLDAFPEDSRAAQPQGEPAPRRADIASDSLKQATPAQGDRESATTDQEAKVKKGIATRRPSRRCK